MGLFSKIGLASGSAGLAHLVKREVENILRDRLKQFMKEYNENAVSPEEFTAVKLMAENALMKNAELQARIETLEAMGEADLKKAKPKK